MKKARKRTSGVLIAAMLFSTSVCAAEEVRLQYKTDGLAVSVPYAGNLETSVTVGKDTDARLITVLYDENGVVSDISFSDISTDSEGKQMHFTQLGIDTLQGKSVKNYLWSENMLIPYTTPVEESIFLKAEYEQERFLLTWRNQSSYAVKSYTLLKNGEVAAEGISPERTAYILDEKMQEDTNFELQAIDEDGNVCAVSPVAECRVQTGVYCFDSADTNSVGVAGNVAARTYSGEEDEIAIIGDESLLTVNEDGTVVPRIDSDRCWTITDAPDGSKALFTTQYTTARPRTINGKIYVAVGEKIKGNENASKITVEYYDAGDGAFKMSYTGMTEDTAVTKEKVIQYTETEQGQWKEITVDDAALYAPAVLGPNTANAGNLCFQTTGADVYIRKITITLSLTEEDIRSRNADTLYPEGVSLCFDQDVQSSNGLSLYEDADASLYFFIDDAYMYQSRDNYAEAEITYFDDSTDIMRLEYPTRNGETAGAMLQQTGTNTWKTDVFRLYDTCFINAGTYESDFRLSLQSAQGQSSRLIVKEVRLKNASHLTEPSFARAPVIWLAGDSTCEVYSQSSYPREGWGMEIGGFFDERVTFRNQAKGGKSTRSFLNNMDIYSGGAYPDTRWDDILKAGQPGDYLFIQFGHNESHSTDERYTEPDSEDAVETSYRYNLKRFITAAREKGMVPVLLTSIWRRYFDSQGNLNDTSITAYRTAMCEVGEKYGACVLDIGAEHKKLVERWGEELSKQLYVWISRDDYPDFPASSSITDNTHQSVTGCKEICKIIVNAIKASSKTDEDMRHLAEFINPSVDLTFLEPGEYEY